MEVLTAFVITVLFRLSFSKNTRYDHDPLFDNFKCKEADVVFETDFDSPIQCTDLCEKTHNCTGVFHKRSSTPKCYGCKMAYNTSDVLDPKSGTRFYRPPGSPAAFTCPVDNTIYRTVGLTEDSFFTYKVYTSLASHADAASNCTVDGAHLVRLTSSAKMDVLRKLIKTCPGYSFSVWIDLTNTVDLYDVNQWVSSVGIPLPAGNDFWHAGEPRPDSGTHCGGLWEGEVDDKYCDDLYRYICEKDFPIV